MRVISCENSRTHPFLPPSKRYICIVIHYYSVLTVGGSDSSGAGGIQADIKTISAQGCYALTALTAVTARNTTGIFAIEGISRDMVIAQIDTVVSDMPLMAVKTGLLPSAETVAAVAMEMEKHELADRLVADPVIVSDSGSVMLTPEAVEALRTRLLPMARLITPDAESAAILTDTTEPAEQIERFRGIGCRNILLKGAVASRAGVKTDLLVLEDSNRMIELNADAVVTDNYNGAGATLSAAIAARMALGDDIETASRRAKLYVTRALLAGSDVDAGRGNGPLNHFFDPKRTKTFNL